ncbi:hypothetical protein FB567DRAFT_3133 [Paraphoma chrysanthemicola]|uniref:Uncharacterized protein n=1 Tax=Paraphoma chrysanthemicola TaxID=798071 RepID=A0A8K0W4Q7_9PLEO|nr:hypothetical protein FB567DRAFT_3133 [Paraphoma chrysanthemicola]
MAFFLRLLKGAPAQAPGPTFDDDEIFPVGMLDGTKTLRNIVVTWTLRFNDVLDADLLHSSLSRLLETGDWRKAGGRLRLKDDGSLEIYVPKTFTAERPVISHSRQTFDTTIEQHPLAKDLPIATEAPSLHANSRDFQTFAIAPDAPTQLDDFLAGDVPLLSLQISSFNNATLVGLSYPHLLMDVMGQQALVRSWSLLLAGRETDIPRLLGAREDIIAQIANEAVEEEYLLKKQQLKGWSLATFGMRFAWDMLMNRVVETRTIYLPKSAMTKLTLRARESIPKEKNSLEAPFISEGDVLTAWGIRALALSLPQPRPITALHALNARFRFKTLIDAPGIYMQNLAVAAFAFIPADVARGPLGPIALANREHLMAQATEPQIRASLRELRQQAGNGPVDPATMLYSDPNAVLMPLTNWTKADFFNVVDFSPAVLKSGSGKPGALVYHHASSTRASASERNILVVFGKDREGGYWLSGSLLPGAWMELEESLKGL